MNNISMRLRAIAGQISGLEDLYEAANTIDSLYAATDWVEDDPVACGPEQIRALIDARREAREGK